MTEDVVICKWLNSALVLAPWRKGKKLVCLERIGHGAKSSRYAVRSRSSGLDQPVHCDKVLTQLVDLRIARGRWLAVGSNLLCQNLVIARPQLVDVFNRPLSCNVVRMAWALACVLLAEKHCVAR